MLDHECLDDALLASADDPGSLLPTQRRHLADCASCRRRARRLTAELEQLRAIATCAAARRLPGADARPHSDRSCTPADGPALQAADNVPTRIGRYRVLRRLATGGQAEVYSAHHPGLHCEVVIKLARRRARRGLDPRDGIEHEGRALAAIRHPNVVRVLDLDVHDGRPFLVLEHVEGPTLRERLRGRCASAAETLAWMRAIAQGVAAAHEAGILHLDLKPENVLLPRDGRPRVIDFGLAGLIRWQTADDEACLIGTPGWMAPEQHTGDSSMLIPQTDVYGLGALLYFLLFGEAPHADGRTSPAWPPGPHSAAVVDQTAVSPAADAGLHEGLTAVCRRALASEPGRRHRTVADLVEDLESLRRSPSGVRCKRRAALLMLGGLASWAATGLAVLGEGDAGLRLDVEVYDGQAWLDLQQVLPLRSGDQLRIKMATRAGPGARLYFVPGPGVVIPCRPLATTEEAGDCLCFPADGSSWTLAQLADRCLIVCGVNETSAAPEIAELRDIVRTLPPLPPDCLSVRLRDRAANRYGMLAAAAGLDREDSASDRCTLLKSVLDRTFERYEALLLRCEDVG